jgi:ferredoxin-NADP reductase
MITSPSERFIGWLDVVTGRVTMYRLVLICLLAILVEAMLVSLAGQLPAESPIAILASTLVAVGVCYIANRLLALAFRVKSHSESALVTGLILALLFQPAFTLASLTTVVIAAVLAMGSKYVLAFRRRHIFNPAAIGALLTGWIIPSTFATNAIAGWWVGNPWLLPVTALGAFAILYRTRHLTMGLVFIVIAATALIVPAMLQAQTFSEALSTAFGSSPIVFFAGFMLSEPLTLAPRRWQQIAEAALVAILFEFSSLFGVGLSIGPLYGGYTLALVIGNLLAFLMGQRRGIQLSYLGRQELSPSSFEFSFEPLRPLRFSAGQYLELTLPHAHQDVRGLRRTFSIASGPSEEVVRLGIRTSKRSSSFKLAMLDLKPGETVTATSVGGDFLLPKKETKPVLLVAGGIGITPYVSHLAELTASASKRDVVIVYSSSSSEDLAYAGRIGDSHHRVLLVAPSEPATLPEHWSYLGAGPLTADLLTSAVPDARSRAAYVSGPPGLVRALKPALRKAGIRKVKSDYFSGY